MNYTDAVHCSPGTGLHLPVMYAHWNAGRDLSRCKNGRVSAYPSLTRNSTCKPFCWTSLLGNCVTHLLAL